jgi:hypothetical protein
MPRLGLFGKEHFNLSGALEGSCVGLIHHLGSWLLTQILGFETFTASEKEELTKKKACDRFNITGVGMGPCA